MNLFSWYNLRSDRKWCMMEIIAYDFDGTIYDGDSSIDFYKFCFSKKKSICKYWMKQLFFIVLYVLGIKNKTEMKEALFCFLKDFDHMDELLTLFWRQHEKKIKTWYLKKNHEQDVIISASPEFLLEKISKQLKVKALIGSVVDIKSGKFLKENCHGEEKVRRMKEQFPHSIILEMYTDSSVDLPMIKLAQKGFFVKKDEVIPLKEYQPSSIQKLKHIFFKPEFIRFILVGCINTLNGVLFSYLYSCMIKNATLAFVIGYITSLVISYLLNSYITFHDHNLSFKKWIKFCISYIPNFLIQLVCVFIIIDFFHLYKLIAYIIAAIIGIPITYLALSLFTFCKKGGGEK